MVTDCPPDAPCGGIGVSSSISVTMTRYNLVDRAKDAAISCKNAKTLLPAGTQREHDRGHHRQSRERRARSGATRKQRIERRTALRENLKTARNLV